MFITEKFLFAKFSRISAFVDDEQVETLMKITQVSPIGGTFV